MPKFSLIVPIYNVERYVSACLDSCRQQTFSDIEIICVDDGSTDRSMDIVSLHASVDDRIKLVRKANGGLSSARNAGMREASGDYLMFVDSDDFLEKKACAVLLESFEKEQADVVTFGANCVPYCDGDGWLASCLSPSNVVFEGFDPDLLFKEKSRPYVWRTAVRKSLVLEHQLFFDENVAFGEDQIFHFDLYPLSKKTILISDKLYNYRVSRKDSLMHTFAFDQELRVSRHLIIVETIAKKWSERGIIGLCPAEFLDWILDFLFMDMIRLPNAESRNSSFGKLASIFNLYFKDVALYASQAGSVVSDIVNISFECEKNVAYHIPSDLGRRYVIYRQGLFGYLKRLVQRPLSAIKRKLKKVAPMPASSMQQYLEESVERIKVENAVGESIFMLLAESHAQYGGNGRK